LDGGGLSVTPTLQHLPPDKRPQGLAFTFVLLAAAYSLGAHASLRRAAAGLVPTVPAHGSYQR
jgi:hypothetical protein